jgi:GT2 family glycosyltransferase
VIGVNLLVCNRTPEHRRATEVALESLVRSDLTHYPYAMVVVDNGSTDETAVWVERWMQERAVRGEVVALRENRGIAAGRNVGYRALLEDPTVWAVIEVHNDMVFPDRWAGPLLESLDADHTVGLAGARLMTPRGTLGSPRVRVDYTWPLERIVAVVTAAALRHRQPGRRPGLQHPVAKRVAMLRQIGLYDEAYRGMNFEDTDEVKRATDAGWQAVVVGEAVVWHAYTYSRLQFGYDNRRCYRENLAHFRQKHPHAELWLRSYDRQLRRLYV